MTGMLISFCVGGGIIGLSVFLVIYMQGRKDGIYLNENQLAWDEYSKDMTYPERREAFLEWCEQRKFRTGNKHYYFPYEFNTPPKYFECIVNGEHYRGTIEDVSIKSKVPLDFLKKFEHCITVPEITI